MKGLSKFPHSKWHELGVELKVPGATLKSIENNYMQRGGVERCFSETMEWWYKNNPGATWGKICAALQAIHEEALARQVAKDHGKLLLTVIHNDLVCTPQGYSHFVCFYSSV